MKKKESKPKQPPAKNKPKSVIKKKEIKSNYDLKLFTEYLKASMIDFDKRFEKLKIEASKLISEHPFNKDSLDSYFRGLYSKLYWEFRFQSKLQFECNKNSDLKLTDNNIREMCLGDTFRTYEILIQMIGGNLTGTLKKRIKSLEKILYKRVVAPNQKYIFEDFKKVIEQASNGIKKEVAIQNVFNELSKEDKNITSYLGFRRQFYEFQKIIKDIAE